MLLSLSLIFLGVKRGLILFLEHSHYKGWMRWYQNIPQKKQILKVSSIGSLIISYQVALSSNHTNAESVKGLKQDLGFVVLNLALRFVFGFTWKHFKDCSVISLDSEWSSI
jgi:hypothetical protein